MLSEKQQTFVHTYTRLWHHIQKRGPLLLIFLVSVTLAGQYVSPHTTQQRTHYNQIQTQIVKTAMQTFFSNPTTAEDREIKIQQGVIHSTQNTIQSYNSLITLGGFVLPKSSSILNQSLRKPRTYFENPDYDIDEFRLQVNMLLTPGTSSNLNRHNNNPLPDHSLYDYFNLHCIQKTIHSPLCVYTIQNFLDIFYTFNIQDRGAELQDIIQNLKKQDRESMCKQMLQYTLYNQVFNIGIQGVLTRCDEDIRYIYQTAEQLYTINNEIANNAINPIVYDNAELNAYKILSIAQQIIQDIENNNPNTRRLEAYVSQMQALMRKPIIDPIYRDMQYRIIHHHIIPYITEQSNRNINLNQIRTQLIGLNRDNVLLQYNGLQNMLINTGLILKTQENTIQQSNPNPENIIAGLKALPYIHIQSTSITQDSIGIQGELNIIDTLTNNATVLFTATGIIQLNRLIITNIQLPQYPLFSTILNTFIQGRNTTLASLYSYINENIALYRTQDSQEICDDIKTVNTFIITICNDNLIQGQQKINNQNIEYKIAIQNNTIQSIQVSDENLAQYLQDMYVGVVSDDIRISPLLKEIIIAQPQMPQYTRDDDHMIQITNTFELFFKTKPIDIAVVQETYYIEFILDSLTFVLAYNTQNNTSGPLFFKDVNVNNRPLRTQRRSIKWEQESQQNINRFVNNPLGFIQDIDPFTYEIYLQFK